MTDHDKPMSMVGWQPIETAPKDGTQILVLFPHYKKDEFDGYSPLLVRWKHLFWDTGFWVLSEEPHYWLPFPEMPEPPK